MGQRRNAYADRAEEFGHARKRKFAMANVLEDLLAQNILTAFTDTGMLNTKLKNLLRAYKATRDNNSRTGAGASFAPYEEIMEQIFGTRPEISNCHTLSTMGPAPSVGLDMSHSPVEPSTHEGPSARDSSSRQTISATSPYEPPMPGTSTRSCYSQEQYRRDRIAQKEKDRLDKAVYRAEKLRLRMQSLDDRNVRFEEREKIVKDYFEV